MEEMLDLQRRPVDVQPELTFQEIGVRSFARGLFIKPSVTGSDIGEKRVFRVAKGDLVVSNVFGWEGAVAVAGPEHDGLIGSHRFMTWAPRAGFDARYLCHYLASETGLAQLRAASPGSAGRNRTLSIKNFEQITCPVPPLPDQRRIAAHLDSVEQGSQQIATSRGREARAMIERAISIQLEALDNWVPLGELCEINPRPRTLDPEDDINFVPMSAVSDVSGTVVSPERRTRGQLQSGYKQALPGDIIFARITPCMQNGKCAVYRPADRLPMYGSTEFHVLRCDSELVDWIHTVLRTQWFIEQAEGAFTGTAGQQRVPVEFLRRVRVPVPDTPAVATAGIRTLSATARAIADLDDHSQELSKSLLPAARNEVFNALQ